MYHLSTLKNGLTLITVNLPHLDSVTTMMAVGAGSRYENRKNNGISHFLEHMAFKGTLKYPSQEMIATLIDSIGAVSNAGTSKEYTYYWIKSASKHIRLASDLLSSIIKESLLQEEEIKKEKGVIAEEIRMYKDHPASYVGTLYEKLQFGDQPLGWDIGGEEKTVNTFIRDDFISYLDSLYSPQNMVLICVGKLPGDISELAEQYFANLPERSQHHFKPYRKQKQAKPQINVYYKKTDQAQVILGVEGYDRYDEKRYAAVVLGIILGGGMSSRLFLEVREKRGLAYAVSAGPGSYSDTGSFAAYAGLKLEKIDEGLEVVKAELMQTTGEKVTDEELKKAKEMIRGRLALRSESTNFLAEYFGLQFVLDREIETFGEYLKNINKVNTDDVKKVARELFQKEKFNLQIIGPFKESARFEKILNQ